MLEVKGLGQEYGSGGLGSRRRVSAVFDVSFKVEAGKTFGLVGETGCGKSSTARAIVQAPRPSTGQVLFRGVDLTKLRGAKLRTARRPVQMVFQDPYASLDPRWPVERIVEEPLRAFGLPGGRARVEELMNLSGLDPVRHARARPRELSGGERQRVAIARALASRPELLICDEAVSALDVSVRAQILNTFERLQREVGLAYVFITHDLGVVRHVSDRIGVMYLGTIVETGLTGEVFAHARHPYTAALMSSVPVPDPTLRRRSQAQSSVEPPSPLNPPSGCRYRTRCARAADICASERPQLRQVPGSLPGHLTACHFPLEVGDQKPGDLRSASNTLKPTPANTVGGVNAVPNR